MIGGSSLFHNIQPREEHSPGDRRVYNQEKTSPEQTQRWWSEDPLSFTTSSQEKNTLQETDVSTIKRRRRQSKHRDVTTSLHFTKKHFWKNEIESNDGKKEVWRRLGTADDRSIQHHLWNMEQCDAWACFQWLWLLCLVMMKSEVYNRDILSAQIRLKQQSWLSGAS